MRPTRRPLAVQSWALLLSTFLLHSLTLVTPARGETSSIPWRTNLAIARQEASRSNRLLWLQFTGPWCFYCKKMDESSFTHSRIITLAASTYVPIKLQADEHEELALSLGLSSLPATVIVRPDGQVAASRQGFMDVATLDAFLSSTLSRESRPTVPPAEGGSPQAALEGYCAVSLVERHKLITGKPEVSHVHEGRLYRFADTAHREKFRKNPERYVPVNNGDCPVIEVDRGELQSGSPRFGALYDGHLYLCRDADRRAAFLRQPQRYSHVDAADREFCTHCWARNSLLQHRDRPRLSLHRDGQRHLVPVATHLEAFRRRTETSIR